MSFNNINQLAIAFHRKRQAASGLAEAFEPVDPEGSILLQNQLQKHVDEMRDRKTLKNRRFSELDDAIDEAVTLISRRTDLVFECYDKESTGFFVGMPSKETLLSLLQNRWEGMAIVSKQLEEGVILDVVFDDPSWGDFIELEWW